jgi:regulator of replication initiation timing
LRVTTLDEMAHWIASAAGRGAARFELMLKLRGLDQERVLTATGDEPLEVADEFFSHVEADRRIDVGQAIYAVFAFRTGDRAPFERAFVSPVARTMSTAHAPYEAYASPSYAVDGSNGHALAATSAIATTQQMVRDVFTSLQRENDHQRRHNETLVRANTGHFDALATGYESALSELRERHGETRNDLKTLREKHTALIEENRALTLQLEEKDLAAKKVAEEHEAALKARDEAHDDKKLHAEMFANLVPVLIARSTNQGLSEMHFLGPLFDSLTEEQKMKLMAILRNDQLVALNTLFAERDKYKKAKDAVINAVQNGGGVSEVAAAVASAAAYAPPGTIPGFGSWASAATTPATDTAPTTPGVPATAAQEGGDQRLTVEERAQIKIELMRDFQAMGRADKSRFLYRLLAANRIFGQYSAEWIEWFFNDKASVAAEDESDKIANATVAQASAAASAATSTQAPANDGNASS